MKTFRILLTALICVTGFSAFNTNSHIFPAPANAQLTLLSSEQGKKWKLISWTSRHTENGKEITENMFNYFDDCENDNITVLFSDHRYQIREGISACNPLDKDLVSAGTWKIIENFSQIAVIDGSDTLVKTIKVLGDSTIEALYTETDPENGTVYTLTETYQAL